LSWLGGLGLVLASLGLYGLLSQAVNSRKREFGIRMAVGASPMDVARQVFRQAAWTSVSGVVGGLALAYWGTSMLSAYLFGVDGFEPAIYLGCAAVLVLVACLAAARPAWIAMRINPIEALRAE
jgi:ABC-type antimicrobial peptide transport system permease subunit